MKLENVADIYPLSHVQLGMLFHKDNTVRGEWENLWQQICSNSRNINKLIPDSLFEASNECKNIKYKFNDDGNICLGLKPLTPTNYSKILGFISARGTPIQLYS